MPTLFGMPTVAELRVFPCTWCQAEPGQPCVRPDGSRIPGVSHGPRWDAWAAVPDADPS